MSDALPFIGTGLVFIPWLIIDLFRGKYFAAVIYGILFILSTFIRNLWSQGLWEEGWACIRWRLLSVFMQV